MLKIRVFTTDNNIIIACPSCGAIQTRAIYGILTDIYICQKCMCILPDIKKIIKEIYVVDAKETLEKKIKEKIRFHIKSTEDYYN